MAFRAEQLRRFRLFQRPDHFKSHWQIVKWWEMRRLIYNLIVGLTGLGTCAMALALILVSEKFKVSPDEGGGGSPFLIVIAIFVYGVMANVCYTGGWIAEIFATKLWKERANNFGEIAFVLGIIFSIALTLLPALFVLVMVTLNLLIR